MTLRRAATRRTEPRAAPEPQAEARAPEPSPSRRPAARAERSAGRVSGRRATSVTMPELGESVTEGTVTRWLKKVGDTSRWTSRW